MKEPSMENSPKETDKNTFDFTTLTAVDIKEEPVPTAGRQPKYPVNPFVKWLREATRAQGGKQIVVDASLLPESLALCRKAASELGLGARVRVYRQNGSHPQIINQTDALKLHPRTKLIFKFWPAPKRVVTRRKSESTDVPTAPETIESTDVTTNEPSSEVSE